MGGTQEVIGCPADLMHTSTTSVIGGTQEVIGCPAGLMNTSKGHKRKARIKVCNVKEEIKELQKGKQQNTKEMR